MACRCWIRCRRPSLIDGNWLALAWALLLGFTVSAGSSLWCYYSYAMPLTGSDPMVNIVGANFWPSAMIANPMLRQQAGHWAMKSYNPILHLSLGAGLTGLPAIADLAFYQLAVAARRVSFVRQQIFRNGLVQPVDRMVSQTADAALRRSRDVPPGPPAVHRADFRRGAGRRSLVDRQPEPRPGGIQLPSRYISAAIMPPVMLPHVVRSMLRGLLLKHFGDGPQMILMPGGETAVIGKFGPVVAVACISAMA